VIKTPRIVWDDATVRVAVNRRANDDPRSRSETVTMRAMRHDIELMNCMTIPSVTIRDTESIVERVDDDICCQWMTRSLLKT